MRQERGRERERDRERERREREKKGKNPALMGVYKGRKRKLKEKKGSIEQKMRGHQQNLAIKPHFGLNKLEAIWHYDPPALTKLQILLISFVDIREVRLLQISELNH